MKRLYLRILVIGLVVCGLSVGLDAFYRSKYGATYPQPDNVLPAREIEDKYQVVKVGNSHAGDGISFEGYNTKALDLANAGQELRYDLAFLKHYSKQIDDGAVILIAATPISFSQKRVARESGLQNSYFGRLSPLYIPNFGVGDYIQMEIFPFLRAGFSIRETNRELIEERIAKEKGELWRAAGALEDEGIQATVQEHEVETAKEQEGLVNPLLEVDMIEKELQGKLEPGDADGLEESMRLVFRKWVEGEEFSREYFEENRRDLERIVEYSLDQGWRPVVITIPISKVLEDGLPDDYMQEYVYDNLAQAEIGDVDYFDFSRDSNIKENVELFGNADHLNKDGALVFSYVLLRKLIDEGYLPESVDGYVYE